MRATELTDPAEVEAAPQQKFAVRPGSSPALRLVRATANGDVGLQARLAVILAADVVAYTRHMAEDEAGTHAWFGDVWRRVVEPGISQHGARIVKHTGDGFLAEFGSATRAVRFAVEFQDAVRTGNARRRGSRRREFRVGINLGDVLVEPHDVFGHNVNVAARLERLAGPGGVLVSYPVVASVRDPSLTFEDAGDLSLANMAETVRGFRVRGGARKSRAALRKG